MAEIRKLNSVEVAQAEALAAALADCIADVSEREDINNIGVISAAILVVLGAVVAEFLDEDEQRLAIKLFGEQLLEAIACDDANPANAVN